MSANRTRLLLADDTDLLARARPAIVGRPEFDVIMAGSTDEALQVVADAPPPGAIVLPADGSIDGLQVCRTAKAAPNGKAVVILALPADGSSKRDACFAAGADDVLFAPVEAADITSRLDRAAPGFRSAPRADVELIVRLANPSGSAVIDAKGSQISREAVALTLPAGTPSPAAGLLVRAVFTLYEGGTLQVWARVAAASAGKTVLRFVGLTEAERRAIDYFVDFYLKRTGAQPAPESAPSSSANGSAADGAASPEELLLSAEIPEAAAPPSKPPVAPAASPSKPAASVPAGPAATGALAHGEQLRQIADATLDDLAEAAAKLSAGRNTPLPAGFDANRIRSWLPKLSSAETSALRGTSMYNNILLELRTSAASRVRLQEMTSVVKEGGSRLDARTTEQIVLAAIAEAQQIHNTLEAGFQDLIRAGNTAAMRDLQPVKAGLLSACVELKNTLDREVLGKGAAVDPVARQPVVPKSPTKYSVDPGAKVEKQTKDSKGRKGKDLAAGPPGKNRTVTVAVILVVLAAGALLSNLSLFTGPAPPPVFRPESILFEREGVRVWASQESADKSTITWIVDGTWAGASEEARNAALAEMQAQSLGYKQMIVIDYKKTPITTRDLSSPTP